MNKVVWLSKVQKQLARVPEYIADQLTERLVAVEIQGIREIRKLPSFHDEPLKGKRKGRRSIRLSKSYRGIYVETSVGETELIEVIDVNKHGY